MRDENNPIVILIADDDDDDRMLACDALAESRLANKVYCVTDGEDLMDYLHRRGKYTSPAESPRPGLILLDLNMPKVHGHQVLAYISEHDQLRDIPVVILTSSEQPRDRQRSFALGAREYAVKPISYDQLLELMAGLKDRYLDPR